jgi:hypothetical protein
MPGNDGERNEREDGDAGQWVAEEEEVAGVGAVRRSGDLDGDAPGEQEGIQAPGDPAEQPADFLRRRAGQPSPFRFVTSSGNDDSAVDCRYEAEFQERIGEVLYIHIAGRSRRFLAGWTGRRAAGSLPERGGDLCNGRPGAQPLDDGHSDRRHLDESAPRGISDDEPVVLFDDAEVDQFQPRSTGQDRPR